MERSQFLSRVLERARERPPPHWQLVPCTCCGWHVTDCVRLTTAQGGTTARITLLAIDSAAPLTLCWSTISSGQANNPTPKGMLADTRRASLLANFTQKSISRLALAWMLLRVRQVNDLPNSEPGIAARWPHWSENAQHATVPVQCRHMRLQLATLKSFEPARLLNKKVCHFVVLAFRLAIKARKANTSAQWPCLSFDPCPFFGSKSFVPLSIADHISKISPTSATGAPLPWEARKILCSSRSSSSNCPANRRTDEVGINHTLQVKCSVDVAKHHSDELFPSLRPIFPTIAN